MLFNVKILENNKAIELSILKALLPDIKQHMDEAVSVIKKTLPGIVISSIISSEEYQSLINNQLKYELGIPDAINKINAIIDIWTKNINYTYQEPSIRSSQIKSIFKAEMIKADFSDVLGTDYASVNDTQRGYSLPWLEWLLLDGKKTIVKDYQVVFGQNRVSRTGMAIMRQSSSKGWSVPSEFSGTVSDNWITRSIDRAQPQILSLLEGAFQ